MLALAMLFTLGGQCSVKPCCSLRRRRDTHSYLFKMLLIGSGATWAIVS